MANVRSLSPASPGPIVSRGRWLAWGWPRLALGLATAAAAILVVVGTASESHRRLAQESAREIHILAGLDDEAIVEPLITDGAEGLADELELTDTLVLAEAPPDDLQWVEQTLGFLEQVDEDAPADALDPASDDEWLEELQQLDEGEPSASS